MSYSNQKNSDGNAKENKQKLITVYSGERDLINCYGTVRVISNSCIEITSVDGKVYTVYNATVIVQG